MRGTLTLTAASVLLGLAACATPQEASAPPARSTPTLAVWQSHTPWGSGPVGYSTSIYDPSLLNDPSMIEEQPHNRGNKSGMQR